MTKAEDYKGFIVSWEEPPLTSAYWTANVASDDANLNALMGHGGAEVINGRTRDDMLDKARSYIDGLVK